MPTLSHYTLRQLNLMVRDAIAMQLPDEYWVEAELSECRERGGHCYMELVEKDDNNNTPVARASAKCWRQTWQMMQPYFERTTGQPLRAGLKVLVKVYAQFHEAYGFSWIVTDIDPTYTLGDMARRRQEIIRQLKEEGVFDLQRELHISPFAKRIAVISASNAAGYGDFCRQLEDNEYGRQCQQLTAQGPTNATRSKREQPYDVVVIIRGGGATADLSGFDTLALAENVAQFPLPIITGIGHDRDESILDMVANTHVKTPTAAATLLIDHLAQTLRRIEEAQNRLTMYIHQRISSYQVRLSNIAVLIPNLALQTVANAHHRIDLLESRIPIAIERRITNQKHLLEQLNIKLQSLDPQILLSRGYSITLKDGRAVRDPQQLKSGDTLETRVEKGTIKSTVQ